MTRARACGKRPNSRSMQSKSGACNPPDASPTHGGKPREARLESFLSCAESAAIGHPGEPHPWTIGMGIGRLRGGFSRLDHCRLLLLERAAQIASGKFGRLFKGPFLRAV